MKLYQVVDMGNNEYDILTYEGSRLNLLLPNTYGSENAARARFMELEKAAQKKERDNLKKQKRRL